MCLWYQVHAYLQVAGVRDAVQLREQDFGNFQASVGYWAFTSTELDPHSGHDIVMHCNTGSQADRPGHERADKVRALLVQVSENLQL